MPNRIWLCGDTHMHSSISDGKYAPDELVEKCKAKGLDWIIITDHNKNAVGDKSYYSENLLVIPGAEYTGRNGHMNIFGSGLPEFDGTRPEKYEQYLCRDFPRVPIINTPEKERDEGEFYVSEELYREYVSAGERLRKLHLMQIKAPAELALEPNTPDEMEIGAIKYKNGVLQLNANKRITGISQEVWKYQIGGHQVLDKWFKEHKGEALTIDSFTHIENIVGALDETIRIREHLKGLHK